LRVLPDPELTPEELEALKWIQDNDQRKNVRKRAQVILLAYKHYQGQQIAEILDMHPNTITGIMKRWTLSRLESITKKHCKGAIPKLTEAHLEAIYEWIFQDPSTYGYKQTTWTCKMLANCLKKHYGFKVTQERIRQILHACGMSYKKPVLQPPTASSSQKKRPKLNF